MKEYNFTYIRIQLEDLIASPAKIAKKFCSVLELECYKEYIDGVVKGTFEEANRARKGAEWTAEQIEKVNQIVNDNRGIFFMPEYAKLNS